MKNMIPCVGFELQYSPLERDCVENLALALHQKSHEFTFEVIQEVNQEQEILMVFSTKQGPTQYLLAEVLHCTKLDVDHYRITLMTHQDSRVQLDNTDLICIPIIKGTSTATEMTLVCPSCHNKTPFRFIANQGGDWEKGILPIYNCTCCGTTRTMIDLVSSGN